MINGVDYQISFETHLYRVVIKLFHPMFFF